MDLRVEPAAIAIDLAHGHEVGPEVVLDEHRPEPGEQATARHLRIRQLGQAALPEEEARVRQAVVALDLDVHAPHAGPLADDEHQVPHPLSRHGVGGDPLDLHPGIPLTAVARGQPLDHAIRLVQVQLAPASQAGPLAEALLVVAVVPDEARLEVHLELEDRDLEAHAALDLRGPDPLDEEPVVPEERRDPLLLPHRAERLLEAQAQSLTNELRRERGQALEDDLLHDRAIAGSLGSGLQPPRKEQQQGRQQDRPASERAARRMASGEAGPPRGCRAIEVREHGEGLAAPGGSVELRARWSRPWRARGSRTSGSSPGTAGSRPRSDRSAASPRSPRRAPCSPRSGRSTRRGRAS